MPVDTRPRYRPVAARHEPVAPRQSARPEPVPTRPDERVDVVVVGSGCGGLATALFCAWRGLTVTLLEKAPQIGGTTRKSASWTWVPNNPHLAAMNVVDDRDHFMRYWLRTARPEKYDPDAPLGASEGDYRLVEAIYEDTWPAVQELHDRGGLRFCPAPQFLDYLAHLEEDRAPYERVMVPEDSNEEMTNCGPVAVESLSTACLAAGVEIRVGYRVQRLLVRGTGEVAGVMASTVDGGDLRINARRGVVFATGGFTHDQELVENFLAFPSLGGYADRTNEGDFVRIVPTVGRSCATCSTPGARRSYSSGSPLGTRMAVAGVDEDFGRGAVALDVEGFRGPIPEQEGRVNPVMRPIAETGPYYGAIVAAGTLGYQGRPQGRRRRPDPRRR